MVANLLHETRVKVTLVLSQDTQAREIINSLDSGKDIEEMIVKELMQIHRDYVTETD